MLQSFTDRVNMINCAGNNFFLNLPKYFSQNQNIPKYFSDQQRKRQNVASFQRLGDNDPHKICAS